MTYVRLIETTGYIQEADAPQPPRSTGKWADVWDRFPAENSLGDGMGGAPSPRKAAREDPMSFREVETGET